MIVRILISAVILFILLNALAQINSARPDYLTSYRQAEKIFHEADNYEARTGDVVTEGKMNRQALDIFLKIIPVAEKENDDSLLFHCYYKTGILYHYFDSLQQAKNFYLKAIRTVSKRPPIPDSFYFKPHLFAGSIYYAGENFDSAFYHYRLADDILTKSAVPLQESERLYNRLGALYFGTGNYTLAKKYFEKALSSLGEPNSINKELFVYYKNNIATSLLKLQQLKEAEAIYKSILPFGIRTNEIINNIGFIQLELGDPISALGYFKKIKDTTSLNIQVLSHMGRAYFIQKKFDSAAFHFILAEKENKKWNGDKKNILRGLNDKYEADMLYEEKKYSAAIEKYHISVINLNPEFNEKDIFRNPEIFTGVFSFINLFNTLTGKAVAFEGWYKQSKDIRHLNASLNTYYSAFRLATYVEQTYNSDEARVFLNKIKYTAHDRPIQISLDLYSLSNDKKYLEDAYYFDQLNKASLLSLNTGEITQRKSSQQDNPLFQQESLLKTAITRLSLKLSQLSDSSSVSAVKSAIRDNEIELGKVVEKINAGTSLSPEHIAGRVPGLDEVIKILDENTVLLSYHLSDAELVTLTVSKKGIYSISSPLNSTFFQRIDSLNKLLSNSATALRNVQQNFSSDLYNYLIAPVQARLGSAKRLIIIPDDELHYLPFDVLQDTDKKYLIEKYSIQYLYSTALLNNRRQNIADNSTVSFAPFTNRGYNNNEVSLSRLAATQNEISNLKGTSFSDTQATRQNFLAAANSHGILHLATHAQVNNENPDQSFIAFYPAENDTTDFRLYAQEIYNLKLDSTRLVILSACETGTGKLVKGEGLMSLSRAFAYAGCPNVITSLWKAGDQSTALIISKLQFYLSRGFTEDIALQKAKIDLLRNTTVDPRFKQPNYWAHLVSIGNYQPLNHGMQWRWVAIGTILLMLVYYFTKKKVRKLPDARSN